MVGKIRIGVAGMDQLTIALAIHDLAAKMEDEDTRKQIQRIAAKEVTKVAQIVVKESQ